jgi:Protein of unknown function (DUF3352)
MQTKLAGAIALIVLTAAAVALAACGSSGSGGTSDLGPDPATMVPADTPFYMEAVVRPDGDMGDALDSALSKLLVTDDVPQKIQDGIDESLAADGTDLTYGGDIAPWLGTRAGIYFNGYDAKSGDPQGAAIVAITDTDAAQSFLEKAAKQGSGRTRAQQYKGVQLQASAADDNAYGIDGDFLLAGTVQGVEDAIDAADGDNFAGADDSTTGFDQVPDDAVFSLFADPQRALDLIKSSGSISADQLKQIEGQLAKMGDGPVDAWGTATDSSLSFGASAPAPDDAPDPTDLLSSLPADAWLAFAAGGVGDQISSSIAQFKAGLKAGLKQTAPNVAAEVDPIQAFQDATGLNLEEDVTWIGDVGGFIQGTSIFGLGGGLVITTDDPKAAEGAVAKLQGALGKTRGVKVAPSSDGFDIQAQGSPLGAEVAVQDDKVVIAAGADSASDVLSPSDELGDSDTFQAAKDALGNGLTPGVFVNFGPIMDLIDSTGESDPEIDSARPYLNALDFLIGGSKVDGDRSVSGLTLGVQDQPEGDSTTAAMITP